MYLGRSPQHSRDSPLQEHPNSNGFLPQNFQCRSGGPLVNAEGGVTRGRSSSKNIGGLLMFFCNNKRSALCWSGCSRSGANHFVSLFVHNWFEELSSNWGLFRKWYTGQFWYIQMLRQTVSWCKTSPFFLPLFNYNFPSTNTAVQKSPFFVSKPSNSVACHVVLGRFSEQVSSSSHKLSSLGTACCGVRWLIQGCTSVAKIFV